MKIFPFIMAAFVTSLLLSNTVAVKVVQLGPFYFDGATVIFPVTYIFGDVLTEVYGYKRSRAVIWTGFIACAIMAFIYWLIGVLPAAPGWEQQAAWDRILGQTPRIVLASLVAYFSGEFLNSYVMSRMKIWTEGRWLWVRTITSTLAGQVVDTTLFVLIAFTGMIPGDALARMAVSNYTFKVGFEVLATPVTCLVIKWLKRVEDEDYYDYETDYNPFKVSLNDMRK